MFFILINLSQKSSKKCIQTIDFLSEQASHQKSMGRPKTENSIQHFSHPHPLFPSSLNPQDPSSCVVCKLKLLNLPSYTCKPCNFHIHQKCFELPTKLRHPFDTTHLLSLIPKPKYQEGLFRCDACGKDDDGFSYHCGDCGVDLHTVCANMPSKVTHQSHPHHQLSLTMTRSGSSSSFCCSVCQGLVSNTWLYRCRECGGFDAHLLCARRKLANPANSDQRGLNRMRPGTTPFVYGPSPVAFNNPYPYVMPRTSSVIRPMINDMINNLVNNTPQNPSQVSQLYDMLGPMGLGGGGSGSSSSSGYPGFDPSVFGSGSSSPSGYPGFDPSLFASGSSSGYLGFDPSVFGSVDPSVFAGFDPSLLSTLFSGLGFLS